VPALQWKEGSEPGVGSAPLMGEVPMAVVVGGRF